MVYGYTMGFLKDRDTGLGEVPPVLLMGGPGRPATPYLCAGHPPIELGYLRAGGCPPFQDSLERR